MLIFILILAIACVFIFVFALCSGIEQRAKYKLSKELIKNEGFSPVDPIYNRLNRTDDGGAEIWFCWWFLACAVVFFLASYFIVRDNSLEAYDQGDIIRVTRVEERTVHGIEKSDTTYYYERVKKRE